MNGSRMIDCTKLMSVVLTNGGRWDNNQKWSMAALLIQMCQECYGLYSLSQTLGKSGEYELYRAFCGLKPVYPVGVILSNR